MNNLIKLFILLLIILILLQLVIILKPNQSSADSSLGSFSPISSTVSSRLSIFSQQIHSSIHNNNNNANTTNNSTSIIPPLQLVEVEHNNSVPFPSISSASSSASSHIPYRVHHHSDSNFPLHSDHSSSQYQSSSPLGSVLALLIPSMKVRASKYALHSGLTRDFVNVHNRMLSSTIAQTKNQTFDRFNYSSPYDLRMDAYIYIIDPGIAINGLQPFKHLRLWELQNSSELYEANSHHTKQQYLDFYSILYDYAVLHNCDGHNMFMLMDDDMYICDGAVTWYDFIVKWANRNWDQWGIIRTSMGSSGIIFKCKTAKQYVRFIRTKWNIPFPNHYQNKNYEQYNSQINDQNALDWHEQMELEIWSKYGEGAKLGFMPIGNAVETAAIKIQTPV